MCVNFVLNKKCGKDTEIVSQVLANFFCKGSDNISCSTGDMVGVCHNCLTLML